jgi:hypothetical protein
MTRRRSAAAHDAPLARPVAKARGEPFERDDMAKPTTRDFGQQNTSARFPRPATSISTAAEQPLSLEQLLRHRRRLLIVDMRKRAAAVGQVEPAHIELLAAIHVALHALDADEKDK